jgi:hypothetical protein
MYRGSATLLAAVLLSLPAAAAVTPTNSPDSTGHINSVSKTLAQHPSTRLVDTLLQMTGLQQQLPEIRRLFLQAQNRHIHRCGLQPADAADQEARQDGPGRPYTAEALQQRLNRQLQLRLQADAVRQMVDWYNSPIGQRVRHSEKKVRSAEAFEQFDTTREAPARAAHIATIEQHTRANRLGTVVGVETEYGGLIFSGCIEFDPQSARAHSAASRINRSLAKAIRSDQKSYEKIFYADTLTGIAFSLQDLDNTELRRYADFVKSPAMSQVFASLVAAVTDTLRDEADRHSEAATQQPLSSGLDGP